MRVYYDCEMVERGRDLPIQLVSIGMVREDGAEFYAVNEECLSAVQRHPWLSVNVAPHLPIQSDGPYIFQWDRDHPDYDNVLPLDLLAERVRWFLTQVVEKTELWAYYGAYDHVVLCQLFGAMGELPAGIPMFTHDLQQLSEEHPNIKLPPSPEVEHHALLDARWVRDAYERIAMLRPRGEAPTYGEITDEVYGAIAELSMHNVGFIGAPDAGKTVLVRDVQALAPSPTDPNVVTSDTVIDIDWIEGEGTL